jgi:hypothetical protein
MNNSAEIYDIADSFQLSDRFMCELSIPDAIQSITHLYGRDVYRKIPLLVKTFNIPNETIETKKINYLGRDIDVPVKKNFDNLIITFYDNNNNDIRHIFDNWMHLIHNRKSNRIMFRSTYTTDTMKIHMVSGEFEKISTIQFNNLFPVSIDDITFDRTQKDTWVEFKVSFTYESYRFLRDGSLQLGEDKIYDGDIGYTEQLSIKESLLDSVSSTFTDDIQSKFNNATEALGNSILDVKNKASSAMSSISSYFY